MGDFTFLDPGRLVDGELEPVLVETSPGDPEIDRPPYYLFDMMVDGKKAGYIRLRVADTLFIRTYQGHIGYAVEPEFRGHHYAERACRLILPLAKAHGMTAIWITCNPDNFASRRTIERLGATFVGVACAPEDSEAYRFGIRQKCRYRLDL